MQREVHKRGSRLVSIVIPESFEDWKTAVGAGLAVATTPAQRKEWGLSPAEDIPIIASEEVVDLTFLAPDDPMFDDYVDYNPSPIPHAFPEEENGEVIMGADGELYKLDEEGALLYDDQGNPVLDERFQGGVRRTFDPESSV